MTPLQTQRRGSLLAEISMEAATQAYQLHPPEAPHTKEDSHRSLVTDLNLSLAKLHHFLNHPATLCLPV